MDPVINHQARWREDRTWHIMWQRHGIGMGLDMNKHVVCACSLTSTTVEG
jgi:hypothetical protein